MMVQTLNIFPGDTIEGQGILFTLQSNAADDAGPRVRQGAVSCVSHRCAAR